jgi:hypothetical protein
MWAINSSEEVWLHILIIGTATKLTTMSMGMYA